MLADKLFAQLPSAYWVPDLKLHASTQIWFDLMFANSVTMSIAGIFVGITVGISSNADTVRALMIALFFHQGNERLALGVLFVKAGYSRLKFC